jgi:glycerol uptake facilitator-like aquaporin
MVFQFIGAIVAGFTLLWIKLGDIPVMAPTATPPTCTYNDSGALVECKTHEFGNWFRAIFQETVGSFCFVFFYISQTESKTVISSIETIHCFVLSASYIAARTIVCGNATRISTYPAILNPSFAIGIQIASWFTDFGEALKWIWLYPVMPFAGAVLAIVFFEFVYKKTQTIIQHNKNDDKE